MNPRIAMAVFSYYPADVRVRRAAEALIDAGMPTDVICLRNFTEPKKEIINGVRVYRLPIQRNRGGKLRYLWDYSYFICLTFLFLSVLHILRRYSIVHVHNMPDLLVFSALIPRLFGSKLILDLHDPMPEVYMTKYSVKPSNLVISLLIFFEKLSIWSSNLILTPNVAFRDVFISRGCPENKIHIVMNSPHEKAFSCLSRNNKIEKRYNDEFRIMFHGTIVERHGLDVALKALNNVDSKIPNIVFHVFGEGDFVETFINLIKQLKLDDKVFYHGQVSHEIIAKEIEFANAGLIPNINSPFTDINMPTRIFEYLCMRKPVIAPRTKGILDYFDEDSLYFFEPSSVENLTNTILDLYNNPEKRFAKLERGIKVYKKYRWELQQKHFIRIITRLLAG